MVELGSGNQRQVDDFLRPQAPQPKGRQADVAQTRRVGLWGRRDAPLGVNIFSGLQHVGLMSIFLVYPVLIAQAAGSTAEVAAAMVSATLIAMAVGTVLQVITVGPIGSGYLCQPRPAWSTSFPR